MRQPHPKPLAMWRVNLVERRDGTYYASIDAPDGPHVVADTAAMALTDLSQKVREVGFGQ